jgi:hypothetical protein
MPMLGILVAALDSLSAELVVPAHSAYLEPDSRQTRIVAEEGIVGWKGTDTKILWYGEIKAPGELGCSVMVRLPEGERCTLRMSSGGETRDIEVAGKGDETVTAAFGDFRIGEAGYREFRLERAGGSTDIGVDIEALVMSNAAAEGAHFNLKPRRNAASVHLMYPVPKGTEVEAFYGEVTAVEDPVHTFYMACGFHRGYFGMQINSASERRIIFSVWDSGSEAVDRGKVADENRVTLMAKGEGVHTGGFGNEGTGGHSHLKFMWKTGEKQRFLVTAEPVDETFTIFSGYYFRPDQGRWMLISSWKAPKEGGRLRGLHSFSENFGGRNGHLRRNALYGNQWMRNAGGDWVELTEAKFSHDATGKADRLDRFMGVEDGQFFLSQGGFVEGFTMYGEAFTRPATGLVPELELPGPSRDQ